MAVKRKSAGSAQIDWDKSYLLDKYQVEAMGLTGVSLNDRTQPKLRKKRSKKK